MFCFISFVRENKSLEVILEMYSIVVGIHRARTCAILVTLQGRCDYIGKGAEAHPWCSSAN